MNHNELIFKSDLISRDLSWLQFNYRVLDQVKKKNRLLFEKLKFLAITASNADEFFMIRVGSLYNYIDYNSYRTDYSGLQLLPLIKELLVQSQEFATNQENVFLELKNSFEDHHFYIKRYKNLNKSQKSQARKYFMRTVFPMLTPMVFDSYHSFPILMNKVLIFGVVTKSSDSKERKKMSFIQIPQNLPRFFEIEGEHLAFVPIESIVETNLDQLFKNVEILSSTLFRVTRNGDFTLDESEDVESNFLEELRKKLKTRKTGRVVRLQVQSGYDKWLLKRLLKKVSLSRGKYRSLFQRKSY